MQALLRLGWICRVGRDGQRIQQSLEAAGRVLVVGRDTLEVVDYLGLRETCTRLEHVYSVARDFRVVRCRTSHQRKRVLDSLAIGGRRSDVGGALYRAGEGDSRRYE